MLKKLLFSLAIILSLANISKAQCTPDVTITTPGVYPDSATGISSAIQGVLYNQVIQVRTFMDSVVNAPIVGMTTFRLDSIVILSFTGLPTGINYVCNPSGCSFPQLSNGCLLVSGTTTDPVGDYPLTVQLRAYGKLPAFPIFGQIFQDFTVDYYILTVNVNAGIAELLPKNKFGVIQNSPNPFGSKSQIYYNTPQPSKVNLKIFNILGTEVYATSFDSKKGLNVYTLDANKFSSGIYMYSISNGTSTITKRMVVSKK